jgi:hypothetical protein
MTADSGQFLVRAQKEPQQQDLRKIPTTKATLGGPWIEPADVSPVVVVLAPDAARMISGATMIGRAAAPAISRDRSLEDLVPMTCDIAIGRSRRQQMHCESGRRGQIGKSHPNPHQGAGALLVAQRGKIEAMPRNFVVRIYNAITKNRAFRYFSGWMA